MNNNFNFSIENHLQACPGCVCEDPCYCDTPWPLPDVPYSLVKALKDGYTLSSSVDNRNDETGSIEPYNIPR